MNTDSIFFDNDRTLFATFKYIGTDFDGDMKRMSENPKVREWWDYTDSMQVRKVPRHIRIYTLDCRYAFPYVH